MIHSFFPVLPLKSLPQAKTVEWILNAHELCDQLAGSGSFNREKLARFTLNDQYIESRHFECDDVDDNWDKHDVYRFTRDSMAGASIGVRNQVFARKVERVFSELYRDHTPAHVVHVTCTGYISPSPAQVFFSSRPMAPAITHAYHMGCYASLPAIRMAIGLHLSSAQEIDVVHTELCSLHLAATVHTPEQMVVQTLFADGHMRYAVGEGTEGLKILSIKEQLIPGSLEDMTWIPDSHGMTMTLSREVPFKIRDALPEFIEELCREGKFSKEEILAKGIFAIHPGGPKIIEAVQKKLELRDDQVEYSKHVLKSRGNMSSATLPHVWHEILKSSVPPGTKVLSLAFGPGLTIFGSLFEVRR